MNLKTPIERLLYTPPSEERFTKRVLLFPLYLISLVFGFIVKLRHALYRLSLLKSHTLPCLVMSIGNIIIGFGIIRLHFYCLLK